MKNFSMIRMLAALAFIAGQNASADTIYDVNFTFGSTVSLYGTITTNGVLGALAASDITGYALNGADTSWLADGWFSNSYALDNTNSTLTFENIFLMPFVATASQLTVDNTYPASRDPTFNYSTYPRISFTSNATSTVDPSRPLVQFNLIAENEYQPYGGTLSVFPPKAELKVAMAPPVVYSQPYAAYYAEWPLSTTALVGTAQSVSGVPEPEIYAMLLAGLGLVGGVARRRKAKMQ